MIKKTVREILGECGPERKHLLKILHNVQRLKGYLTDEAIEEISRYLGLSENEVCSVASFYSSFRFSPAEETAESVLSRLDLTARPGETRVVMRNIGFVDPENIDDYVARGGYATGNTISAKIREKIEESTCAEPVPGSGGEEPKERYIICSVADPTARVDRILIEHDPHAVLDGMETTARVTGASQGLICIDNSHSFGKERLGIALKQARDRGLLAVPIEMVEMPSALVLGVKEALIAALEGKRAVPATDMLPHVFIDSAEGFARLSAMPHAGCRETGIFVIEGDVARPGLVEVPLGTTLRQIIFDLGGGMTEERTFKAAQAGGRRGGFLSAAHLDETVVPGSLLVAAGDKCVLALTMDVLSLLEAESCGKCVSCREGTIQMREILSDILAGRSKTDDLSVLADIGTAMKDSAFCAFGRNAPDPLLTSIRNFPEEYEVHMKEQQCPATR